MQTVASGVKIDGVSVCTKDVLEQTVATTSDASFRNNCTAGSRAAYFYQDRLVGQTGFILQGDNDL